jgi:long-chain acyl-CoA synthetase
LSEVNRIFDLLEHYPDNDPNREVFAQRSSHGWKYLSLHDYRKNSAYLARALIGRLNKGDRIATVSNNRWEWNIIDMASAMAGMVHVPIYPTICLEEFRYILIHAGARILFVSNSTLAKKLNPLLDEINTLEAIYSFDRIEECPYWLDLISDISRVASKEELESRTAEIQPDDLLTLIYTSGTTGKPKGVMLSHRNILSNIKAVIHIFPMENGDRVLSILPLCHITERMVNYVYQFTGIKIFYARSWNSILKDLRDSRAQGFVAVPRVLEKILEKIMENALKLNRRQRWMFNWAMDVGGKYKVHPGPWLRRQLKQADKWVYIHWRKALGGPKKFIACGGAFLDEKILKIFLAAGFPVHEGYGMTETSPLISINHFACPDCLKPGTQGRPLNNVEVRIGEDDEIQVKGPNVMLGYFREPDLTRASFCPDGWFCTGDTGKLDKDGFLKITGRKKEIFKTSGGKYIAPLAIERVFVKSSLIDNMVVVGENQKFPGAIIRPNLEYLANWADNQKIRFRNKKELIKMPKVVKLMQKEVDRLNKNLGKTEQIKDFRLVHDKWSVPTGELSPTMKVRRFFVTQKYEKLTRSIYRPPRKRSFMRGRKSTH